MEWLEDVQGAPLVVGGPSAVLLLGPHEPEPVVDLLSRAAASRLPERAVRAVLGRVDDLPISMAVAVRCEGYVRVFLRGSVEVSALDGQGRRQPTRPGHQPRWEERTFVGDASVRLSVIDGTGRAIVAAFLPPPASLTTPTKRAEEVAALDSHTVLLSSIVDLEGGGPTAEGTVAALEQPEVTAAFQGFHAGTSDETLAPTPLSAQRASSESAMPKPVAPEDSVLNDDELFEHLLSETRFRGVEAAAVRDASRSDDRGHQSDATSVSTSDPATPAVNLGRPPSSSPPSVLAAGLTGGLTEQTVGLVPTLGRKAATDPPPTPFPGLIDAVPSFGQSEPPSADVAGPTSSLETMSTGPVASRPQVQAVMCLARHPNSPQATHCRQCGVSIEDHTPRLIPRPSLGRFRFDDGLIVELNRPLLLGRNPSTPKADASFDEEPEAIALRSPERDVSRLHAHVTFEGWHVLITDCKSRNGTLVVDPNEPPVRLRSGESHLLLPGARVMLGPGLGFVYESVGS